VNARGFRTRQNLALALVALALFMRVLIPAGFMPATDASGGFPIVVCTGEGMATGWLDDAGRFHEGEKPQSEHRGKSAGDQCPFSGAAGAWTLDHSSFVLAEVGHWPTQRGRLINDPDASPKVTRPPPARGPPLSV
jgi:hypothetical protein